MFLAFDLGTTSLAGCLMDDKGQRLTEIQVCNPQTEYGADVLRRLEAARDGKGNELQSALVDGISRLIADLLKQVGGQRESIAAIAAAANPAISTLLQNQPVAPLLLPPYKPKNCSSVRLGPEITRLNLPVPLYLFPLVNGFVGGDLVAFLFGQDVPEKNTLYIDIGTNGEIALFANAKWWVTSVAAGPAFEGGDIGSGMLYGPGAIQGCRIEGDRFVLDVVGDLRPKGICGSGLVEVIAAALKGGLIDQHGSIVDPDAVTTNLSRYIVSREGALALQLHRDADVILLLEQKDIRNFQLAKAAVHAGVECLLKKAEIEPGEIHEIILTGAFGLSLAKSVLKRVAMLPENMIDKVRFEPGGALRGVCRMLTLEDGHERVEALVGRLKPYPLSGTPAFEKAFIKAIDF